ncbi:phage holin family protein [Roseibacillus ishigakijimensis]|uniref:Phage holin family protein n=1 Tax=Roseibacillus ishigakijimensis TaxID=454146 RepID=A0A934VN14_9BACT|nr:phage holin family protein [Roseibacillus ishigakijimensis]MBK1834545.1 phage holin family protein [Roseibacillus ishigakijimensis]
MVTTNRLAEKPRAREAAAGRGASSSPVAHLLSELTADASHLFRQEVALAKAEISTKVHEAARHLIWLFAGLFLLCVGMVLAMAGLSYGVAQLFLLVGVGPVIAQFLGFLFFGSLVLASGIGISLRARNKLTSGTLMPKKSARQLSATQSWAESKLS